MSPNTIAERLDSALTGPIGSSGRASSGSTDILVSSRRDPIEVSARRRRRHNRLRRAFVAFWVFALVIASFSVARAADATGYWKYVGKDIKVDLNPSGGEQNTQYLYKWQFIDEATGTVVTTDESFTDKAGNTITCEVNIGNILVTEADPTRDDAKPSEGQLPDGYALRADNPYDTSVADSGDNSGNTTSDTNSAGDVTPSPDVEPATTPSSGVTDSDPITKAPNWGLSWDCFTRGFVHLIYCSFLLPFCKFLMELGGYVMSAIDVNALFTADFSTGSFATFYQVANTISDRVAIPYGSAFLSVVFCLALLRSAAPRSRLTGPEWMQQFLGILLLFMISWTLITHAMDVMAALYWLGQNLVLVIQRALDSVGVSSGGTSLGAGVSTALDAQLDGLTYGQAAQSVLYLLLATATVVTCLVCVIYIFSVGFIRMCEIYLRAAFAAVPMAFFSSESTRQMGWAYLKRFGAVCFQAGVIVVALALSGLLMGVASNLMGTTFGNTAILDGNLATGFAAAIVQVLPPLIAIGTVTGIVKKSESICNGLFGLAG